MTNKNNNLETVTCNVVKDLLPLYSEELCSEDSADLVKTHLETCESCKKLLENLPLTEKEQKSAPDEAKTMRKLNRRMKRSKRSIILLLIALVLVVAPVLLLTINIYVQNRNLPSFETLARSRETKGYLKLLKNDDLDTFMAYVGEVYLMDSVYTSENVEELRTALNEYTNNSKISSYKVHSHYSTDFFGDPKDLVTFTPIVTDVTLTCENGTELEFNFSSIPLRFLASSF